MHKIKRIILSGAGQARCICGALLCKVEAPSRIEVKCRRCARVVKIEWKSTRRQ